MLSAMHSSVYSLVPYNLEQMTYFEYRTKVLICQEAFARSITNMVIALPIQILQSRPGAGSARSVEVAAVYKSKYEGALL